MWSWVSIAADTQGYSLLQKHDACAASRSNLKLVDDQSDLSRHHPFIVH